VLKPAATLSLIALAALAAPAQAVTPQQSALRSALRAQPHASSSGAVQLPLPAPLHASAAAASHELATLARRTGPGRVLVGLRTHQDRDGVTRAAESLGASVRPIDSIGVLEVRAPSVAKLTAGLRHDPGVAYLEQDKSLKTADFFDAVDSATGIPYDWAFDAVHAGPALQAAGGGSKRQVAVIDTGVDAGHPDLAGHIGKRMDTATGGTDVTDYVGHGTFVAGLIAADGNNGIGGRGVAGNTMVYPVRASLDGSFTVGDLLAGLQFSIASGADIVNLSLAGDDFDESQSRALDDVFLSNVLPVAAAGNQAEDGNPLEYPASALGGYRGGGGIGLSVAAVKPDLRHASFSDHNEFVSLAAPGASESSCSNGVFSTLPHDRFDTLWDELGSCNRTFTAGGGRYAYAEGTSFSAPIAAGIAALVWQVNPRLQSEQVGDVLAHSARQTMGTRRWNEFTGRGVVDGQAATALAKVYDTTPPPARARARKHGPAQVKLVVRRVRDRTKRGDRLAGGVSYAVLDSTDNGESFNFVVHPRGKPFRKTVRLRGHKRHLLVASVCDRNGNCTSKRLGRFRRI
jgi:subtilisin family serine protease